MSWAPIQRPGEGVFGHLLRNSRRLLAAAVLASVAHGACSVVMISQISLALYSAGRTPWPFLAAALGTLAFHSAGAVAFVRLSQRVHAEIRRFLFEGAMAAELQSLERTGPARVQAALAEHGARVGDLFLSLPLILTNTVVVAGCLLFMATLSAPTFLAALAFILLGSITYYAAVKRSLKYLDRATQEQDGLFGKFASMTAGATELRLNTCKAQRFRELTYAAIDTVRRSRTRGLSIFAVAGSWGNFLVFGFIALVLYAPGPFAHGRGQVMIGFSLVLIYMITPLQSLLTNIPYIGLARSSASTIDRLLRELRREPPSVASPLRPHPSPHRIELKQVVYRYPSEPAGAGGMGPLDLVLETGEVVFVVGGNGSGKTTLGKVLAGLYAPDAGEVWADGARVHPAERVAYRERFSAVFADYHLFDNLLQTDLSADIRANHLLRRLQLDHKVKAEAGAFSTTQLSQGQRKRLALVAALLEDRPFLIFDEWAADQDPPFKEIFYRELLHELKAHGKGVIVISHDDRYFSCGDRVLFMEDGQLVASRAQRPVGAGSIYQPMDGIRAHKA
ncbi:cyclic peptide export ABC transporter [Rubrivivax gelatinosus]|uniref:cyclic peptide export ABC transporter n=1 Tax=Rubrivivax gelatinosus TaxID=28068 RepID=UPI0002D8B0B2|nr:cyclic peptide export ABC transporter [Rubrivivax gelatinosus]MBG6082446.1 putative ATP-binding cassette transporter [Rubrivivax gelatinosus]